MACPARTLKRINEVRRLFWLVWHTKAMLAFLRKKKESDSLVFFNTLGKEKQEFKSLRGRYAKLYTCGPTVYDHVHIGNLRSFIFSDVLRRTLEYFGYEVKHVINITDLGHLSGDGDEGEDKMSAGLKREGLEMTLDNMKALGERYAQAFIEDLKELNVKLPFAFPRASDHVPEQIAFIESLFDKGYAYTTSDGVYFDTAKFAQYGALGGTSTSEEHSRVGINPEKRHPQDFALWKFNKTLGWDASWGKGFPGWHIECTAMSTKYLGKSFDIHTGGIDLIPVHHNNEIAQSEAATGKPYARYWMHGAFATIEGKRIGKSEGNAIRLYQLKERGISPLAYRYLVLTSHYRSPMNFTWEALEAAQTTLYRALRAFADLPEGGRIHPESRARFETAIKDDLNMPEAVSVLWEVLKDETISPSDTRATVLDFDRTLGVGFADVGAGSEAGKLAVIGTEDLPEEVSTLVEKRELARAAGDWAEADRLRGEITGKGYSLEDTKDGPKVRKST